MQISSLALLSCRPTIRKNKNIVMEYKWICAANPNLSARFNIAKTPYDFSVIG